jgi:hypothetical protein
MKYSDYLDEIGLDHVDDYERQAVHQPFAGAGVRIKSAGAWKISNNLKRSIDASSHAGSGGGVIGGNMAEHILQVCRGLAGEHNSHKSGL